MVEFIEKAEASRMETHRSGDLGSDIVHSGSFELRGPFPPKQKGLLPAGEEAFFRMMTVGVSSS